MEGEIVNRVANSGLVTLDLEALYPPGPRVVYDIAQNLFGGFVLREKDFRDFLKAHDWQQYKGNNVAIICSEDAIVPSWAYMLLALKLQPVANMVIFGSPEALEQALFQKAIAALDVEQYRNAKVVVKGCSDKAVPTFAYVELTRVLAPVVSSLMFGEACSSVPLYKKPKQATPSE